MARVDSLAAAFLAEAPAVGFTLAVVRGGDTLLHRGYGLADREAGRPAGPATVYRIASITKQFTAAAVLQLVEQGRLALTDTLGRYLPRYPQWGRVTIRQLLNHTSGIPPYPASPRWASLKHLPLAPDSVLGVVAGDTLDFAPGSRFRYNATGYFLLGLVLERVTGVSYDRYVAARFFRPLGMRSATYCPEEPTGPTHARGYRRQGRDLLPAEPMNMRSPGAGGGLCMSVADYLRWQHALTSGRVVRPETYARMARSDTLADGRPTGEGWGLQVGDLGGRRLVYHAGNNDGFATQQLWLPEDALRVVVFANTARSGPTLLARNVARAALGQPLEPWPPRQ